MTRIARIISDISVICCFFYGQRITRIARNISVISVIRCFFYGQRIVRITRNYFVLLPDEPDGWRNIFSKNPCISCCPLAKIYICCRINFCPRCPKPMNSYNSLIIIDITSYIPIKSPKIHPKSLLLYIFFANFLSYPFSKLPDPNDVVSSINAYGVNS